MLIDLDDKSINLVYAKRGKVKEFSSDIEQRLVRALRGFLGEEPCGQEIYVTLTTKMTDPKLTKDSFRKWMGAMCYAFDCCGIYVVEFSAMGLVHYHLALRFFDSQLDTKGLADACFERWERYGDRSRKAFSCKPVTDRKGLVRYMAKLPAEGEEAHPERWQKSLPLALKGRGLGANWWGYVNRQKVQSVRAPVISGCFELQRCA